MAVICLKEQDMFALGGLRFPNRLKCAQNCHKFRKISQNWLRPRENGDGGGFCRSAANELWDLATS